ncbi:MAG: sigma factor-like helix-turn-helix DNA-binding protein [Promethearchaeota archaeon]|jgi:RNA polymerase sigma factor (sigma-70 family)
MLEDKVILPICHKWAKILWKRDLDYDELVSVAYCISKPLNNNINEEAIASWIKYTLIRFIYQSTDNVNIPINCPQSEHVEKVKNFKKNYALIIHNKQIDSTNKLNQQNTILDIKNAINNLSEEEAQIIYMRFWLNKTYKEIGEEFGHKFNWGRDQVNRIIGLMKNEVLR